MSYVIKRGGKEIERGSRLIGMGRAWLRLEQQRLRSVPLAEPLGSSDRYVLQHEDGSELVSWELDELGDAGI